MFCEEPVLRSYEGENEAVYGADSFFDYYHELAYHVTEGFRIVLETEHYYISLDVNGVELIEKRGPIKTIARQGEDFDPFVHQTGAGRPWADYESTLFTDEKLCSVETQGKIFLLQFDDFLLKLVPHDLNEADFPDLYKEHHGSYNHVLGYENRLTKKCCCGGKGELLLDFVSDYVVRCCKCKKSTYAEMIAQNAIEAWNKGEIQCDLSDISIE